MTVYQEKINRTLKLNIFAILSDTCDMKQTVISHFSPLPDQVAISHNHTNQFTVNILVQNINKKYLNILK